MVGYPDHGEIRVSVCGPAGENPPLIRSLDPSQAERLAAAALVEPTRNRPGGVLRGHVDRGTAVLLRKAPEPPTEGRILDLGCGYGPIALALAARSPATEIWAVDVNERALALTVANAAANQLANVRAATPDDVPPATRFDAIYSNPPVRVGKDSLRRLLAA